MLKIAILASGGGTNLQAVIDKIEDETITNAEIKVVISNKSDAYALERAKRHGIHTKYISPKDYPLGKQFAEALLKTIDSYKIDLIVLAGYLLIIPQNIVRKYRNRIINIHPSLIPAFSGNGYYGIKVHKGVLTRGNKVTGATVHFVDEGTDTGPIILQKAVNVNEMDTPESLQRRVMEEAEWDILPEAIDLIANDKIEVINDIVKRKRRRI